MPTAPADREHQVRAAELIAATCLATDLGMGFPFEHGLHSTLVAMRLAEHLGVDRDTSKQIYYACLLSHAGCTTDAHVMSQVVGGSMTVNFNPRMYGPLSGVLTGLISSVPSPESSPPAKVVQIVRRFPRLVRAQRPHLTAMCEVAEMLGAAVGAPPAVQESLHYLTDRWDGRGPLRRAKGDELPLPMRIVHVALDANRQRALHGKEGAVRVIRHHAGHALDPEIVTCLADGAAEILAIDDQESAWAPTLDREPKPHLMLDDDAIDRALLAIGNFADLISPFFTGHSGGVAALVAAAAEHGRLDKPAAVAVRRAAFVHDVGRVAVDVRTWEKPGRLNVDEWEHVRLHPYHTERVLSRSALLSDLAPMAGAHHERLDGSGYHRGVSGRELSFTARLLAAADAYHAMTEPRPYRKALSAEEAAQAIAALAREGQLDPDAVTAVIEGAGYRAPRLTRPAELTEREAEVIAMLARGFQTKQMARALGISVKTADRHIQNAYRKIGVSTRAAATLFAMEHGLVAWGELPIARLGKDS